MLDENMPDAYAKRPIESLDLFEQADAD